MAKAKAKITYVLNDYRHWQPDTRKPHWRGGATAYLRGGLSIRVGCNIHGNKGWPSRAALKADIDTQLKKLGLIS